MYGVRYNPYSQILLYTNYSKFLLSLPAQRTKSVIDQSGIEFHTTL
jgi:hypothetical protein